MDKLRGPTVSKAFRSIEAYFVVIDHTLSNLFSLKEYIDDTEDFIDIKLVSFFAFSGFFEIPKSQKLVLIDLNSFCSYKQGNLQNQLIKFEVLLTAATFVAPQFLMNHLLSIGF
ncbi:hypothetical protein Dimus_034868 [Dionaea muscipula]